MGARTGNVAASGMVPTGGTIAAGGTVAAGGTDSGTVAASGTDSGTVAAGGTDAVGTITLRSTAATDGIVAAAASRAATPVGGAAPAGAILDGPRTGTPLQMTTAFKAARTRHAGTVAADRTGMTPGPAGHADASVAPECRGVGLAATAGHQATTGAADDPEQSTPLESEPSPARLATRRFLATCVEVIGGFRPMAQLRPLCFPEQFDDIADRLRSHPVTGPAWRSRGLAHLGTRGPMSGGRGGVLGPPRTGRVNQSGPGDRVVVRRVQLCEAIDGVAEIAVVLARRDQVWAMALRMEHHRDRWLCAHLEVL
jgi:hypothetical protein